MSEPPSNNESEPNKDTPEEDKGFVEGVVDGAVETILNPIRWGISFLFGGK